MDNISTQQKPQNIKMRKAINKAPAQHTINFIRQFARVYMPVSGMPGLVLN